MLPTRCFLASALTLAMACATASSPSTSVPAPLQPAAHSSIEAVLQHQGELDLTAEQVQSLRELDGQLLKQNETLKAEHPEHDASASSDSGRPAGAGPGRGMGGHRGGGMQAPRLTGSPAPDDLRERLGENDTRAYLQAQLLLTDAQKPRADEIASRYRSDLYDWQEYAKQHASEVR